MKRGENETLCWIMRWGWITWKQSLAFNNDNGKKLYNLFTKKIKKIKTSHLLYPTATLPASVSPCPCDFLWNGNQKKIMGNFSITNQERILRFVDRFNMHWLHSKLQTIIYTDLSLSAPINCLACLSLSLCALCSSSSFSLASSSSFSTLLRSALLKI